LDRAITLPSRSQCSQPPCPGPLRLRADSSRLAPALACQQCGDAAHQFGLPRMNEEMIACQHVEPERRRCLVAPGIERLPARLVPITAENLYRTGQALPLLRDVVAAHQEVGPQNRQSVTHDLRAFQSFRRRALQSRQLAAKRIMVE